MLFERILKSSKPISRFQNAIILQINQFLNEWCLDNVQHASIDHLKQFVHFTCFFWLSTKICVFTEKMLLFSTMHRKCHFCARKSISGVAPTSHLKENLMSFNFIFSTFFSDAIWNSPAHSKWTQEFLKSTRKPLSTLFQNFSKAFKWKHSIAKLKCTYSKICLNAYSSQTRWILAD